MPTPLPARHRFWRRFALAPETARNLYATVSEFGAALLFVAVAVLMIARFSLPGTPLPSPAVAQATVLPLLGP